MEELKRIRVVVNVAVQNGEYIWRVRHLLYSLLWKKQRCKF